MRAAAVCLMAAPAALAQSDYPGSKVVTIVVPFAAGGTAGRGISRSFGVAPSSSAGSARAWDETADGIVAMGVKLGLPPWDRKAFEAGRGEQFPVYAARVRNALRKMETGHAH